MWGLQGAAGLGVRRVSGQGPQSASQRPPPTAIVAVVVHDYVGAGVGLTAGCLGPGMAQQLGSHADLQGHEGHGHAN